MQWLLSTFATKIGLPAVWTTFWHQHLALCTNTYRKSFFPKAFQSNFSCIILTSDQSSENTARKNNYGVRKWTELGLTCDHWPGTGPRQKIGQSDEEGQSAHDKFEEFSKSAAISQHFISLLYTAFILCLHSYKGGYCLLCLVIMVIWQCMNTAKLSTRLPFKAVSLFYKSIVY